MTIRDLLKVKINLIGTIAISVLASASTLVLSQTLSPFFAPAGQPATQSVALSARSVTTCESGVYSPVQKKCVSKAVFDQEMQRLFAALGIDTSIYGLGNNKN